MSDEQKWVVLDKRGRVISQVFGEKAPAKRAYPVERFGDVLRERFDASAGEWVTNAAVHVHAAIDAAHHANHGPAQLAIDRAIKELEARVILGKVATDGRLAQEAELRDILVEDMARLVLTKVDAQPPELARIAEKQKYRDIAPSPTRRSARS